MKVKLQNPIAVLFFFTWLTLLFAPIGLSVWGAILAFHASFWMGALALVIEPLPLILGLCALLGHSEVAQRAWDALCKLFA